MTKKEIAEQYEQFLELYKDVIELSQEVLKYARNTLLVNLRFLDAALSRLEFKPCAKDTLLTNGSYLLFNPIHVLKSYKSEKERTVRDYLHVILHCIFQHMYINPSINRLYWDLACDIAVEAVISELDLRIAASSRSHQQPAIFKTLTSDIKMLTAERIYDNLIQTRPNDMQVAKLRASFYADNHEPWYMTQNQIESTFGVSLPGNGGDGENDNNGDGDGDGNGQKYIFLDANTANDWKTIAHRMQVDMETFGKQRGDRAGNFKQNLKAVTREKYDYESFLRKFAVMGEVMKINDDEFDYIYYTYGLQLYKKVPLIEPLEYKDVKRVKEFVIAIDTSGSVQGELVQAFMQKTYNILKSTESFFSKVNILIIQCDTEIQEAIRITCQEEFDKYIQNMSFKGFGGTDFRPVFDFVNNEITKKTFTNLKGLIYFTDGCGVYPSKKPPYETAFVFVDDDYNDYDVPSWAIKLILPKKDI
jgi:predicted metal-dependent peptidase